MASEHEDVLGYLRTALREMGYAEVVEDEASESSLVDRSRVGSLHELIAALEDGVIPAMRATAEAIRLLAERKRRQDVGRPRIGELSSDDPAAVSDDPAAVRLVLDPKEADRVAAEASELERLLGELRRRVDADRG